MDRKAAHKFLLAVLPSVSALVIFFIGFALGRYYTTRPLQRQIIAFSRNETLGQVVPRAQFSDLASAYENKAAAATDIDRYSYSVPNVMTPFVGSGPKPGRSSNVFINSMQFRSTKEVTMPKPPGAYRIFFTGGSVSFGSGAPSQESIIADYIERGLNHNLSSQTHLAYEVFTMANPGWASTHERIIIENRLSELAPNMVISFSGLNDVHWAGAGRDVLWFRNYADQHFWDLLNAARRAAGFDPMADVVGSPGKVTPEQVASHLEKNVQLSVAALHFNRASYVFVLQPMIAVTTKPLTAREQEIRRRFPPGAATNFVDCYEQIRSRLSAIQQENYLYIDQSDIFSSLTSKDEIFLDSYHFADRGNKFVADAIAAAIHPQLTGKK
jgi:hypothetical protein